MQNYQKKKFDKKKKNTENIFPYIIFSNISEKLMVYPQMVAFLLMMTGIVLFFSEFKSKHQKEHTDKLSLKHAILIGLAQGLAAFPGFSRSGWTIATGLFMGLDRVTAARYSSSFS